jgi:hypothetical protein
LWRGFSPAACSRLGDALGGWRTTVAVAILAAACGLFVASQGLVPADDAYITFRHVRNLVEAGRPAWNLHGEPVLGSTSPAYMLVLAGAALFSGGSVADAALLINSLFQVIIVVLVYLIARDLTGRNGPSLLAAAAIGFNSVNVLIFSQGFESPMLVATLLACLYLARTGRYPPAMVLASLAPLIRPEGILVSALVWGLVLFRKDFQWRLLAYYLPIPLVWLLASTVYYGSPVPHPLKAIAHFPVTHEPFEDEPVDLVARLSAIPSQSVHLWRRFAGPLLTSGAVESELALPGAALRYAFVVIGCLLAFLFTARPQANGRIVYFLFGPLFLLLFGWLGHTKPWYFPPFVTFGLLTALVGWSLIIEWLTRPIGVRCILIAVAFGTIATISASMNCYCVNRGQVDYAGRAFVFPQHPWGRLWNLWETQRFHEYRAAAERLNEISHDDQRVLISEVGVFGYYFRGEVVDSVGLCSPEALPFFPPLPSDVRDESGRSLSKAGTVVSASMVRGLAPDFVVNSKVYIAGLLRPDSLFLAEYHEVAQLGRVWGEPLVIYKRNEPSDVVEPQEPEAR